MTAEPLPARLRAVSFARLPGWGKDDLARALAAFRLSAAKILASPPKTKRLGPAGALLVAPAEAALALPADAGADAARAFFETHFVPKRVHPTEGKGFVTGYYEPEIPGALTRSDQFPVPIYARPDDLHEIRPDDDRGDLDPALTWARRRPDGRLEAYPDRGAIMAGAIEGEVPVLAWVEDWVEAFFVHVQGSARIRLADGGVKRVTFAGKTGHPYFAIAKVLVEKGLMTPPQATADVLKRWLKDNPDEAPSVMARNRSFIFFREAPVPDPALGPIAAADVPLTPGRSLAVDRHLLTFHTPVFVESRLDGPEPGHVLPFRRLMIAQDTGSAILGPSRGDIFFGTGETAWRQAARVRHPARFTLLVPRGRAGGGT